MSTVYLIEKDRFADFAIDAEESVQICNRDGSCEMVSKAAFLMGADVYATLENEEARKVIDEWLEMEVGPSDDEHDGQPTEYEEWQDYYGGDDWDHGQYGEDF
jgi:hypothetical protein